jgi:glycosyltransferase involved in cell wall biosynthesis
MPIVSIIIPVYNPGPFLREALNSVLAQTYTDWELIVVDDNSSEDVSWVNRDFPQAKYIRQAHGGASVARNNGILNSSGTFISFMDQDDLWRPEKLARQVAALSQVPDAALCYCDLELIGADSKPTGSSLASKDETGATSPNPDSALEPFYQVELDGTSKPAAHAKMSNLHRSLRFFATKFIVPSTVMLRRECLATSGLLDPFIPFSGDFDLIIKLGGRYKIIWVPSVDVLYRKHSNNFSDQYEVGRQEVEAMIDRYTAYAKSKGDRLLVKEAKKIFRRPRSMYAAQAFDRARYSLKQQNRKEFLHHMTKALWFHPIFVLKSIVSPRLAKFRK